MQDKNDFDETDAIALNTGVLIDTHHATIYRYAFRLAGRQSEAEDITQQTFLVAHQKLSQLKNPSAARSWLMTIARNCYLKRLRAKQAIPASALDVDVEQVEEKPNSDENSLANSFGSNAVEAAIRELDDNHRLVIMMFYFEKLSYKQIAAQLDVAVGTIMSRLSRAKIKLRDVLAAQKQNEESGRISG